MGADLADMSVLMSKLKKRICLLLVLDIYSKHPWVILLEDKKGIIITVFQKVLNKSGWKPNKILADKGSEFCNISMNSWLQNNDIEMYSTHNKGASEPRRAKSINIRFQYQKMCILIN